MKTVVIIGLTLFGVLFLLALSAWLYFDYPLPAYEGDLRLHGLREPVQTYFDEYAVPHVYAENEHDLFFAAGYLAARERLFQMTVTAAAVEGRLSELFGEKSLSNDIYLRTWGIPKMARIIAENMHPDVQTISTYFCDGINAYIDASASNLPIEFKLLRIQPIRWQPAHVAGFVRLMGHNLTYAWKPEIILGQVAFMLGEEKMRQLWPVHPEDHSISGMWSSSYGELWEALSKEDRKLRACIQKEGNYLGSNNWVISGQLTETGKPMLANDPHLPFSQPATWYEMHLVGGRFNVSGTCMAGIPIPVMGQNESCAWGFTNLMVDDIDFFIETTDPEKPDMYLYDGEWYPMVLREESIKIKDSGEVKRTVRETIHGPVISDIHPFISERSGKNEPNQVVTMKWTGHDVSDELYSILQMNLMKNWDDFNEAAKTYAGPGQNVVYADTAGNIGWRPFAQIPLRKGGEYLVPMTGESSEWDWVGYVPFEEIPSSFNPPGGIIVTANNKVFDDSYPYYVSAYWRNPSRANRIWELLSDKKNLTVNDMKKIQNDVISPFSREVAQHFVQAYDRGKMEDNPTLKLSINLLRDWDGNHSVESSAAAIFNVAFLRLLKNIYGDEMDMLGDGFYDGWIAMAIISQKNLFHLLTEDREFWFDNKLTTSIVERKNDILRRSLQEGVKELEIRLGHDPANWRWGSLHHLSHFHSISKRVSLLGKVFGLNVGPFESGGTNTTINSGEYLFYAPYDVVNGPSFRRIVDFSQLDLTQFIIPTGQSGLPKSPYYADQAPLYNTGKYRTTFFEKQTITNSDFKKLVLIPSSQVNH